jgi:hypothetical protein
MKTNRSHITNRTDQSHVVQFNRIMSRPEMMDFSHLAKKNGRWVAKN